MVNTKKNKNKKTKKNTKPQNPTQKILQAKKKLTEKSLVCSKNAVCSNELFMFFEQFKAKKNKPFVITEYLQEKISNFDLNLQQFIKSNQIDSETLATAFRKMINAKNEFYLNRFLMFNNNTFFDNFNIILNMQSEVIDWDDTSWVNL